MKLKLSKTICILGLCTLFVISGCSKKSTATNKEENSSETDAIYEGEYAALLPFEPSDAAQKHATSSTNLNNTFTIGNGLMELSKQHFSPNNHTFREGKYLDYNALDATDGSTGLLGRTSKDNPHGMNPEIDAKFPVESGGEISIRAQDVLLLDIYELDWYKAKEINGISFALVLNDKIGSDTQQKKIQNEKLKIYGEECARKLVSYLRKTNAEIQNIPIYVALYNATSSDETLPGSFFEDAYFKTGTDGKFSSITDKWVLFPTSEATKIDGTNATYFDRYKASFKDFLTQDVSMIGKGHYEKNELTLLQINVTLHARSSAEVRAAVQLLNEKLSIFASTSFRITVIINADNQQAALIERPKGTSKTNAIESI
ncbi:MAG: CamS family sex pheromone protein [Longicatena sp.]